MGIVVVDIGNQGSLGAAGNTLPRPWPWMARELAAHPPSLHCAISSMVPAFAAANTSRRNLRESYAAAQARQRFAALRARQVSLRQLREDAMGDPVHSRSTEFLQAMDNIAARLGPSPTTLDGAEPVSGTADASDPVKRPSSSSSSPTSSSSSSPTAAPTAAAVLSYGVRPTE